MIEINYPARRTPELHPYVEIPSTYHENMQILSMKFLKIESFSLSFFWSCVTLHLKQMENQWENQPVSKACMRQSMQCEIITLFLWKSEGNNNERNGRMWWNKFGAFTLAENDSFKNPGFICIEHLWISLLL